MAGVHLRGKGRRGSLDAQGARALMTLGCASDMGSEFREKIACAHFGITSKIGMPVVTLVLAPGDVPWSPCLLKKIIGSGIRRAVMQHSSHQRRK